MEKMKELAEKKAKEERLHLEEELETVLLVEKLQELRALRVQKLKKQGRFFPEEDDQLIERVRATVEEEERLAAAAADTKAAALAIASAEEAGKLASSTTADGTVDEGKASIQHEHEHEHEQRVASPLKKLPAQAVTKAKNNVAFGAREGLPPEFYRYFYDSSTDMGTLIEVHFDGLCVCRLKFRWCSSLHCRLEEVGTNSSRLVEAEYLPIGFSLQLLRAMFEHLTWLLPILKTRRQKRQLLIQMKLRTDSVLKLGDANSGHRSIWKNVYSTESFRWLLRWCVALDHETCWSPFVSFWSLMHFVS